MKFNKANVKFALNHGIQLDINYEDGNVLFFKTGEEENFLEYILDTEKDELTFKCQVYGDKIEDLPQWVTTSKQLNEVVKYVSQEFKG